MNIFGMSALFVALMTAFLSSGVSASLLPTDSLKTMRLKGGEMLSSALAFSGRTSLPSFLQAPNPIKALKQRLQIDKKEVDESDCENQRGLVERSIVVDATADDCFRVASGFENYPKWAGCNYIRVLKTGRDGFGSLVQMKVGMFGTNLDYTLLYKYQRPHRMSWHAVSGSIKSLVGTYEFVPLGPKQTKVIYKLNVDPGFWMPGAVRTASQKLVAGAALNELKKYTELPSTKLLLAGSNEASLDPEAAETARQRVYMLRALL